MTWESVLIPVLAAAGGWLVRHWQAQRTSPSSAAPAWPGFAPSHPLAAEVGAVVRQELALFLGQLTRSAASNPESAAVPPASGK